MLITKRSVFTNQIHTMEIPVRKEDYEMWEKTPPNQRPLIQQYFHYLTADEREFILSGCTPNEWDEMYNEEE